jgi:Ca2+-binding RTX toxin-like protein
MNISPSFINSGLGDDTITLFGAGGSQVDGQGGTDTLILDVTAASTAQFTHSQSANFEKFDSRGGSGNDSFSGGAMIDTLNGGGGDDTLRGESIMGTFVTTSAAGGDILIGGSGTDTAIFGLQSTSGNLVFALASQATSTVTFSNGTTLLGFEAVQMYSGTGNDSLTGGVLGDLLFGFDGNDTLDGGLGSDSLLGGSGDDLLISAVGNVSEAAIDGGIGTDMLLVDRNSATANLSFTGTSFVDVSGTASVAGIERISFTSGNGNDLLTGFAGNDTLLGGGGDDTINAFAGGLDSLDGGAGTDVLRIDRTSDTAALTFSPAAVGTSTYTFIGGTTATGFERIDILSGSGNDVLAGGAFNDTLVGGLGDDTVFGSGGVDLMIGGAGTDKLILNRSTLTLAASYDASGAIAFLPDGTNIQSFEIMDLETGSGNDTLLGGSFADRFIGNAGRDLLSGGGGNDTLVGGDGADTLDGGTGANSMSGGSGADSITGDIGNDTVDGGLGNDSIDAGDGDNTAYGGDGFDLISSGAGADLLAGDAGNDTLQAGAGADFIYGGSENDVVDGGDGNDILLGDAGSDSLFGGNGDDFLFGGTGLNVMEGGAGMNVFNAAGVYDIMGGGDDGNKYYRLANGASLTSGGALVDEFVGGAFFSNDTVYGGGGNDYLYGGGGDDLLVGDVGSDVIFGQAGNDTLEGGAGVNLLWANDEGSDQIRINIADGGTQVIEFFEADGVNDAARIIGSSLTSYADFLTLRANIGSAVGSNLLVNAASGAQLYLNLGATQTAIWFQGVSAYSLTSADFLFG